MVDIIVIAGAPGSGKSSLAELLRDKLNSTNIDYGRLRELHLDREWKNQSAQEEQITFENLLLIVRNYLHHNYRNIIIHDLRDFRVQQIPAEFQNSIIITLISENSELEKRIRLRNEGWKDTAEAIKWNEEVKKRSLLPNEHKIDNTYQTPEKTLDQAMEILSKHS